jgi:molybdopterin synthase catalytic subunit
MYAIAVVGDSGTEHVAETIVDHLTERGTVGTVRYGSGGEPPRQQTNGTARTAGRDVHRAYSVSADGDWAAAGDSLSLQDALAELARTCDYAVVEAESAVDLPTVVVGDGTADTEDGDWSADTGEVLARVSSLAEFDAGSTVASLEATDPYETLGSLVARVKRSADEDRAGAIATFTGRVRAKDHADDSPTESLEFERYDGVAETKMAALREELESREGVYEVRLHHKTGVVEAGEDIVFVVVLAGHRTEAFRTVEDGINRLKEEVPLFKKEVTVEETFWAHTGQRE